MLRLGLGYGIARGSVCTHSWEGFKGVRVKDLRAGQLVEVEVRSQT